MSRQSMANEGGTHRYLDEFREYGHLGEKTAAFLCKEMERQFPGHRAELMALDPDLDNVEAAACAFYEDCIAAIERAMDGFKDDEAFERYVRRTMSKWFSKRYDRTLQGKIADTLRKKLLRDARFEHRRISNASYWGLKDGGAKLSAVPERRLRAVASRYELPVRLPDADKTNGVIRYGTYRGHEVEDMIAGVLRVADGLVHQPALVRVFMSRLPQAALPLDDRTRLDDVMPVLPAETIGAVDAPTPWQADGLDRLVDEIAEHRRDGDFKQWLCRRLSETAFCHDLDIQAVADRLEAAGSLPAAEPRIETTRREERTSQ